MPGQRVSRVPIIVLAVCGITALLAVRDFIIQCVSSYPLPITVFYDYLVLGITISMLILYGLTFAIVRPSTLVKRWKRRILWLAFGLALAAGLLLMKNPLLDIPAAVGGEYISTVGTADSIGAHSIIIRSKRFFLPLPNEIIHGEEAGVTYLPHSRFVLSFSVIARPPVTQ